MFAQSDTPVHRCGQLGFPSLVRQTSRFARKRACRAAKDNPCEYPNDRGSHALNVVPSHTVKTSSETIPVHSRRLLYSACPYNLYNNQGLFSGNIETEKRPATP